MTQPLEILLIEDNEGDVIMVQRALRQVIPACNLQVVNDGTEALELLFERSNFQNKYRPHLILLDLNLPGIKKRGSEDHQMR
jgi:CheY-like chemotaxis protein